MQKLFLTLLLVNIHFSLSRETIIEWALENNAIVDSRLYIGSTYMRGMFASGYIPENTNIFVIPNSIIIPNHGVCEIINLMEDEMKKGHNSLFFTYFNVDDSESCSLPETWDDSVIKELDGLPELHVRNHTDWFMKLCKPHQEKLSQIELHALWIFVTRSTDLGVVPLLDLLNHNTGLLNTNWYRDEITRDIIIKTSRDIYPGEEIFNSYKFTSTLEIFNNYGFLEPYPRIWDFSELKIAVLDCYGTTVLMGQYGTFNINSPWHKTTLELYVGASEALKSTDKTTIKMFINTALETVESFDSSIDDDEEMLGHMDGQSTKYMAVLFRLAYKKDLMRATTFLEKFL